MSALSSSTEFSAQVRPDEEVARLNLATLGVRHTEPAKTQAKYRGVAGPHKADQYRY